MALGFLIISLLMPEATHLEQLFIAATLATTGIAVTAQVLAGLGRTHSREAQIVFRAPEWDDVLGLVALTIITGIALTGESEIGRTVGRAALFFICAFGLGPYFLRFLTGLLLKRLATNDTQVETRNDSTHSSP